VTNDVNRSQYIHDGESPSRQRLCERFHAKDKEHKDIKIVKIKRTHSLRDLNVAAGLRVALSLATSPVSRCSCWLTHKRSCLEIDNRERARLALL